ncbi:hypothetical protein ACGFMM_25625 [Streptomyces sp. NPDC048604]|uniref:hypothetical protein n=1 Tax=Streptomyces sp. NPDC048604 TaxID=3365578 RepID=UPI00371711CF
MLWFRLPPGYFPVDLEELDDWEERLTTATAVLGLGQEPGTDAGALRRLLGSFPEHGVTYAAFGLHPVDDGALCVSLLTFAELDTRAPGPAAAAARCALASATAGTGLVRERALVRLTCGTPAALVTALLPDGILQARLTVARPAGGGVVLVDLTTPAAGRAAEYTDILLAVGQTVAFTDPDATEPAGPVARPSRLHELR